MNSNWFKLFLRVTKIKFGRNLLLKGIPFIYNSPEAEIKIGNNVTTEDVDGSMPNDLGVYSEPIIGGKFIKIKEILIKLSDFMPLYGMLFSIGAYLGANDFAPVWTSGMAMPMYLHVLCGY